MLGSHIELAMYEAIRLELIPYSDGAILRARITIAASDSCIIADHGSGTSFLKTSNVLSLPLTKQYS